MMASYALQQVAVGRFSRLDVRAKLMLLLLSSTLIFVWNSLYAQLAMLLVVVAAMLLSSVPLKTVKRLSLLALPALILITLIQGLWSPFGVTPVFVVPANVPWLGSAHIFTVEGLLFGLVVCCRILIPMLAFQLVFMTTTPNQLVLGLTRLGMPYRVALLFSTTFRFVPLLLEEFAAIRDAQRLRGIDLDSFGMVRKLVAMGRMLVPLITGCMAKGQAMELALQARGFTGSADRTQLHPARDRLTAFEKALVVFGFCLLAGAIVARLAMNAGGSVL